MSEEIKRMAIEELRAENEALRKGVDYYEEVLRLRAQTWADAKLIDSLRAVVLQYREDLFFSPDCGDNLKRRLKMIEEVLK